MSFINTATVAMPPRSDHLKTGQLPDLPTELLPFHPDISHFEILSILLTEQSGFKVEMAMLRETPPLSGIGDIAA